MLLVMAKYVSCVSLETLAGSAPLSWLLRTSSTTRRRSSPMLSGSSQDRRLQCRCRCVSCHTEEMRAEPEEVVALMSPGCAVMERRG